VLLAPKLAPAIGGYTTLHTGGYTTNLLRNAKMAENRGANLQRCGALNRLVLATAMDCLVVLRLSVPSVSCAGGGGDAHFQETRKSISRTARPVKDTDLLLLGSAYPVPMEDCFGDDSPWRIELAGTVGASEFCSL
jgi:hypothetical protein